MTTDAGAWTVRQETAYPRHGSVRVTVEHAPSGECLLAIRIPAWADGAAVGINGEPVAVAPGGYAQMRRAWRPGDTIDLTLPLSPRLLVSHPLVEETTNQVAVQRGPVVYCAESVDLPDGVATSDLLLPRDAAFVEREIVVDGVTDVGLATEAWVRPRPARGLYAEVPAGELTRVPITLIPYALWANRGPSEMSVWLPLRW